MEALILLSEWQKSQIEFWRKTQYAGYDVSNFGRLRSWWTREGVRFVTGRTLGAKSPVILKFTEHRQGYLETTIYLGDGSRKICKVHRLVAQAFIDNPNCWPQVNHLTGIKSDCRKDGLEWTTQSGNQHHANDVGLKSPPSGLGKRLTNTERADLYERHQSGVPQTVLASIFGISRPTVKQNLKREEQSRRMQL